MILNYLDSTFFSELTGCRKDFLDSMKQLKDVSGMGINAIYPEQMMYLNLLYQQDFYNTTFYKKKNIIFVHCNCTCIYCIQIKPIFSITLVSVVGTGAL